VAWVLIKLLDLVILVTEHLIFCGGDSQKHNADTYTHADRACEEMKMRRI
jgi:hypothetical protein